MKFLKQVEKEHADIEMELIEIDTIIEDLDLEINYPNLMHILKKLYLVWSSHEKREEGAFNIFEKEQIKVPVETMIFEHKKLRVHNKKLKQALESGSDFEIKKSLRSDLKEMVFLIREHIKNEEEFLYSLPLEKIFNEKEKQEIDKRFGGF